MSNPFEDRPFPRGALISAAVLVGFALVATTVARYGDVGTVKVAASTPVMSRDLQFEDRADGAVIVLSVPDGKTIQVLAPGSNNFVRGVLRGLARERRLHQVGKLPHFNLTRWADGRISLHDTATNRTIELDAFGSTNARAFASLLPKPATKTGMQTLRQSADATTRSVR